MGCSDKSPSSESNLSKYSIPSSNGTHNELTIFCDNNIWNYCGVTLVQKLAEPVSGLPQNEPRFDLSRLPQKSVSQITKRSKSILSLRVIQDSSAIIVKNNLWAEPQLVIQIIAPSLSALNKMILKQVDDIIGRLEEHDISILFNRMKKKAAVSLPLGLKDLGIKSMLLAKNYKMTLDNSDLKIFRADTRNSIQYLMAWYSTYSDESDIIVEQNDLMKKYFEGAQDKSFLTIEPNIPIDVKYGNVNSNSVIEHHGLFRTEGGFGGGPFITYSYLDKDKKNKISLSVLVYAPGSKKRKILLELESMLRSVKTH